MIFAGYSILDTNIPYRYHCSPYRYGRTATGTGIDRTIGTNQPRRRCVMLMVFVEQCRLEDIDLPIQLTGVALVVESKMQASRW